MSKLASAIGQLIGFSIGGPAGAALGSAAVHCSAEVTLIKHYRQE